MLKRLTFTEDWRCFKEFDVFEFRPGVNLLVGDQGCGKSSLLETIKDVGPTGTCDRAVALINGRCKSYFFDFEKGNPRTLGYFTDHAAVQVGMMFSSHGQTNMALLHGLDAANGDCIVMVDEPDSALSIRSCMKLVAKLKNLEKGGAQVIAAVHNPIVIQAFEQVYSLEHRKWLASSEFMGLHLEG